MTAIAAAGRAIEHAAERQRAGDMPGALILLSEVLVDEPGNIDALGQRALILAQLGRLEDALPDFERLLALRPGDAGNHCNFGNVLANLGRKDEAIGRYQRAIALDPALYQAHYNLGNLLSDRGHREQAVASYDRAIALRGDSADAYSNRGNALTGLGRAEEALASYERALALEPDRPYTAGQHLHVAMHLCRWRDFDRQAALVSQMIARGIEPGNPFGCLSMIDDPVAHRRCAELDTAELFPMRRAYTALPARGPDEPLRIGYVSGDLHNHATMHLIAEMLEAHDKSRFHITAFSIGPDFQDDWRDRATAAVDRFVEVRDMSDRAVADLAREMGIDIAIDMKGFTNDARLGIFAERAAPIQVSYLGYPGSIGADFMDYLIADPVVIPAAAGAFYSEKIVRLPDSYQANCRVRAVSERRTDRADHGLPDSGFVFCCFNSPYKIIPRLFAIWMTILRQAPGSVLWLLVDHPTARDNLRREAQARGIDPDRLIFAPRMQVDEHLERLRHADLFLDTFPCNAHTTASDALRMGVPIVTCAGRSFASRVAASLLLAVSLPELIVTKMADYQALAIAIATRPERHAALRRKLEQAVPTSALFDSRRFTRHIEAAYVAMHERRRQGLPPGDIEIPRSPA